MKKFINSPNLIDFYNKVINKSEEQKIESAFKRVNCIK